jgi:ArsR family transcriptional regulator, arsenate/arsenite/antimonite-responsive transcriptional repressor
VNDVYRALADPTRRRILQLLRHRDMTAGQLAEHFELAKPTLSRHFAVLREADLIQGEKNGTSISYRLNLSVLEEALMALLSGFNISTEDEQR